MAKKTPPKAPSLTRISVVDVPKANAKGINQENDEMRKLAVFANNLADKVDALDPNKNQPAKDPNKNPLKDSGGGKGAGDVTNINIVNNGGGGKWALTVLHKGITIFREKWQQALNFLDGQISGPSQPYIKVPIGFEVETAEIANSLKADVSHPATQANIKASTYLDVRQLLTAVRGLRSINKRVDINNNINLHGQPVRASFFELVNDLDTVPEYSYYGTTDEYILTTAGVPTIPKRAWQDLRAVIEEFSWSITGTEHNTVRFNADGELVETNIVRVIPGGVNQVEVNADLEINNGKRLIINDPTNLYPTSFYANLTPNTAVNYYLPVDAGLTGQVLESDGTGNLAWVYRLSSLPAGTIHQTLRHNGTTWEATNSLKVAPGYIDVNVPMQVNDGNVIQFWNTGNTNFVALKSHNSLATDTIYTLPLDDGTLGQVLTTDGVGRMSWETVAAGATNQIKLYKLDFNKALPTPQTHPITLPINSEILRITVRVDATLLGSVGQIKINGSTSIILADEGIHYLSAQGKYDTEYTGDATIALAGMVGNLEYVQFGVGSGSGRIFIEVGVPI